MIHKRSTAFERPIKKILEGLSMFNGTNLTLMWIKTHRCLVRIKVPNLSIHHLLVHTNQDKKRK